MNRARLLAAASLVSLAFCLPACFGPTPQRYYYYPSDLDAPDAQLYAWPSGGKGEFRFLAQDDAKGMGGTDESGQLIDLAAQPEAAEKLLGSAGSLTVMLGPGATSAERARALELVRDAGERHKTLSVHVVNITRDLQDVRTGWQVHSVLSSEASFRAKARPSDGFESCLGAIGELAILQGQPNYVAIPLQPDGSRFVVIGDLRQRERAPEFEVCDADALAQTLQSRLNDVRSTWLTSAWGSFKGGERFELSVPGGGGPVVALLVPHDIPTARRQVLEQLASKVWPDALAGSTVAFAEIDWDWNSCSSLAAVRDRFPSAPDWRFVCSPVTRTAVAASWCLPPPSSPAVESR